MTDYRLTCLMGAPWLMPYLEPARYGIDKAAQEEVFQRVQAGLSTRDADSFRKSMGELTEALLGARADHAVNLLIAQYEYATTGYLARNRLTLDEYRTLTAPWLAVTSRPLFDLIAADERGIWHMPISSHVAAQLESSPWAKTTRRFEWGDVHTFLASDRRVRYEVTTGHTGWLHLLTMPVYGLPYAAVWSTWMIVVVGLAWLAHLAGLPFHPLPWLLLLGVGATGSVAFVSRHLHRATHRVEAHSPLHCLVGLACAGRDGGVLTEALAAGWTWDRLNTWPVAEVAGVAGEGKIARALVAEALAAGWPMDEYAAPEVIRAASRALAAARRVGVGEAEVEVRGLVRESRTDEDMTAAVVALVDLADELDAAAVMTAEHLRKIDAPVVQARQADEADRRESTAEAARARAAASLASSRQEARLTAQAHAEVMRES